MYVVEIPVKKKKIKLRECDREKRRFLGHLSISNVIVFSFVPNRIRNRTNCGYREGR